MDVGATPPGWYQDYQDAGLLRWWDGAQWTVHIQPRTGPMPPTMNPQFAGTTGAAPARGAVQPASGRHERPSSSKRDLHAEVDRLQHALDGMGVTERDQLAAEVTWLRDEVARMRREHAELSALLIPLRAEIAALGTQRA
jgi:Protein of unknown function (DUF2510)